MRIGVFTDSWLPTKDGIVTSILRFQDSLESLGHEVYIFAPADKTGQAPVNDHTFYFKSKAFRMYPDYRMAFYPAKNLNKTIKDHDIEILHNHGVAFMALKAMFSSRQLKLPILLHFHTWVTDAPEYYPFNLRPDFLIKLSWIYLKSLCRRSDGVVAPSEAAINELRQRVPGMKYTNSVAPGIDFQRFHPGLKGGWVRMKHELNGHDLILHVGRLSFEKNLELVFDAMPIIKKEKPNAKLMVVGIGPAEQHYKALVKKKGLEKDVIFTGFVTDQDLPNYYAACDTFVLASKFETLGIVMTEALACGKPVAGINARVVPEVVRNGYNGYLFEEKPYDCAEKVLMALESKEKMKNNAIESVKKYDTNECAKKLVDIYKKVIDLKGEKSITSAA